MDKTKERQRAAYFTPAEQELIVTVYEKYRHIFCKKSNTAASAREREMAWQKIADKVNTSNPGGCKRTWQQIKVKYKNIIQTANRKKVEAHKTAGGPTHLPFTPALDQTLIEHEEKPIIDSVPGGISSEPLESQDTSAYIKVTEGVIELMDIPPVEEDEEDDNDGGIVDDDDDDDDYKTPITVIPTESAAEETITVTHSPVEESRRTSTQALQTMHVKELYTVHLEKQIQKCDLQMDHMKLQMQQTQLQIKKTSLEIEILEQQLYEMKKQRNIITMKL